MCGIAGWLSFEEDVRERRDALEAMSGTLANRGPDDHGMYITPSAGLVHRRLAVVDIAGGRQPMREGDDTIVYNGELYNTEELRRELAGLGWEFRGHSDTEVLLKAFVQWGEGCLEWLSGIYAFAVWNERQRRLFAARDRVGVKPFFFYEDGHRFIFGSVIPTLIAAAPWCEGLAPRLDEEGRRELFLLGPGRRPGSGVLKGYRDLEPGHCLWYGPEGLSVRRYWDLKARPLFLDGHRLRPVCGN